MNNNNVNTELRDIVVRKKKMISENQTNLLNAVGFEQKERKKKENNLVLFGVPASTSTTYEEREKEDENISCQILEKIGISKAEQ